MPPKERVMCALELGEPDCVPTGEVVLSQQVIDGFGKGYKAVDESGDVSGICFTTSEKSGGSNLCGRRESGKLLGYDSGCS